MTSTNSSWARSASSVTLFFMTSSFGKFGVSSEATADVTASRTNCLLNVSMRPHSRCGRRRAARSKTCSHHYSRMMTNRLHLPSPRKKSCHYRTKCVKSTPPLSQEPTKVEVQAFSPHLFFILSYFMLSGTLRHCRNLRVTTFPSSHSPTRYSRSRPDSLHSRTGYQNTPCSCSP